MRALPDDKFGTAYVRASGYEPFGPGGTLKIKSKGRGNVSNVRAAELHLSNAVISKAIEFGEYYKMEVYAEDNTTNVVNGTIKPFKLGTNSGPFPPNFWVGSNSVLRLCGEINFGTRNNSPTADITLGSTAAGVADMPTGTIAFDGRITRLPRRLQLDSPIRLEFNAPENVITNLNLRYEENYKSGTSAVVSFGASYALSNGQALVTFPRYESKPLDFDLNGATGRYIKITRGAVDDNVDYWFSIYELYVYPVQ